MLTLLNELRFLTLQENQIFIKESDYGSFKFNDRTESTSSDYKSFFKAKQEYAKRRGLICMPTNKHPAKLKASIKHFEEELTSKKVVYCGWNSEASLNLMLSNGLLIWIEIDTFSGDIKRISFDKYFIGKLISENICDVLITRQYILISYDENQITYVYLQKPSLKSSAQKIIAGDPKIFNIIIGGQVKKINRNMVINMSNDLVIIWTKSSKNEFFPWRPSIKDQEHANVHIYKLNRSKFEPLCFLWTENNPMGFEFSKFHENEVHSVEQKISRKGDVTIESCTYHISSSKSKLQRVSVTSIPLQTEISCCAFSPDHEKLLMGCIDGSIVLFDEARGTTYLVRASFIPSMIAFHPDSALFMIANERGQLQCFDISLSCIKNQLLSEDLAPSNLLDLSSYFMRQPSLLKICWSKKSDINNHHEKFAQVDCFLLLLFDGILAMSRFVGGSGLKNDIHTSGLSQDVLIHMYLSLDQVEKAINMLLSLNWDTYGAMCLLSLHKIANYIFKFPATPEHEELLEKALGSFHIPAKPLCSETENEFGDNVDDITRRFFHYLIRYKSFEKAYRLAIDINDKDLFMILHKCSKAYNKIEIANEAIRCAQEIYEKEEEDYDSPHSTCSLSSCSICSSSYESDGSYESTPELKDESEIKEHPPLPTFSAATKNDTYKSSMEKLNERSKKKNSELTFQNLEKFNNNTDHENQSQHSVLNVIPNIDQTIGIPIAMQDAVDFSKANLYQPSTSDNNYGITTTIHNYPLISGSIPTAGSHSKVNFNTQLTTASSSLTMFGKKEPPLLHPVSSILTNTNNIPSSTNSVLRKEGGEKNKVKFSDTITVAVVPEISRKEKMNNFNERVKRKPFFPMGNDPIKKELAASLPLCHPNQDYLKDFMPASEKSSKSEEKKTKPSIKVVNFGVL